MIRQEGERIFLDGAVTMNTVPTLLRQATLSWDSSQRHVSFARTTDIDSAALALMLHWSREAQAKGGRVIYEDIPANLTTLMALYGLDFLTARQGTGGNAWVG